MLSIKSEWKNILNGSVVAPINLLVKLNKSELNLNSVKIDSDMFAIILKSARDNVGMLSEARKKYEMDFNGTAIGYLVDLKENDPLEFNLAVYESVTHNLNDVSSRISGFSYDLVGYRDAMAPN